MYEKKTDPPPPHPHFFPVFCAPPHHHQLPTPFSLPTSLSLALSQLALDSFALPPAPLGPLLCVVNQSSSAQLLSLLLSPFFFLSNQHTHFLEHTHTYVHMCSLIVALPSPPPCILSPIHHKTAVGRWGCV